MAPTVSLLKERAIRQTAAGILVGDCHLELQSMADGRVLLVAGVHASPASLQGLLDAAQKYVPSSHPWS